MSTHITLYDLPSTFPGIACSPSTWITRYSLNFKGLTFDTEWVIAPEIESFCKKFGASPTSDGSDGSPMYTLPVIHDHSTGAIVSESLAIAKYLDKTYPETPQLISPNLCGVYEAFALAAKVSILTPVYPMIIESMVAHADPATQAYLRGKLEPLFGKKIEEMTPSEEEYPKVIKKLEAEFDKVAKWFGEDGNGRYILGDTMSLFDVKLAAILMFMKKTMGVGSKEWRAVNSWNGGKWERLLQDLKRLEGGMGV